MILTNSPIDIQSGHHYDSWKSGKESLLRCKETHRYDGELHGKGVMLVRGGPQILPCTLQWIREEAALDHMNQ